MNGHLIVLWRAGRLWQSVYALLVFTPALMNFHSYPEQPAGVRQPEPEGPGEWPRPPVSAYSP